MFDKQLGVVTKVNKEFIKILLSDKKKVSLSFENMKLIRDKKFQMKDKFKTGDVVTASLQHSSGLNSQITAILKTPHYQRVTIWGENGWVELVDSSHPDTPGPSFMKIVMNDGTVKEENFEWTDTVSANIHNFIDSIEGKSKYLFTDVEKFQNISVLEAIYKSSLSKQNEKVESFN